MLRVGLELGMQMLTQAAILVPPAHLCQTWRIPGLAGVADEPLEDLGNGPRLRRLHNLLHASVISEGIKARVSGVPDFNQLARHQHKSPATTHDRSSS